MHFLLILKQKLQILKVLPPVFYDFETPNCKF